MTVAQDPADFEVLVSTGQPVLLVDEDEQERALVERWKMASAKDSVSTEVTFAALEPGVPLLDVYPLLRAHLPRKSRTCDTSRVRP